jgi:hypothetical protein
MSLIPAASLRLAARQYVPATIRASLKLLITRGAHTARAVATGPLGTVLSLALAVAVGVMVLRNIAASEDGHVERAASSSSQRASRVGASDTAGYSTGGSPPRSALAGQQDRYVVIVLVASEPQADHVRASLEAVYQSGFMFGPELEGYDIVVIPTEEEARFFRAIADRDTIRHGLGLPPTQLLDLRGP